MAVVLWTIFETAWFWVFSSQSTTFDTMTIDSGPSFLHTVATGLMEMQIDLGNH